MTLALAERETGTSSGGQEYVIFSLNEEEYAFDALNVREIIEFGNVTKVPHLPDFFKGVINLRGTIIPVVDLKQKFGMESGGYQKHTCVIVTEFSKGVMGVIVDAVSDVMYLPDESISSTPSFGTKIRTDFIKGMGKVGNRLVLMLDVEKVLTEEEALMVSEQLSSSAAAQRVMSEES
jgi:purine-binding chemotaxis protein CheW